MPASEIRAELVEALKLDLVGPDNAHPFAHELLPDAPSRWYLTGFLVPAEAPVEQKTDETSNEEIDSGGDTDYRSRAALMVRNNEGLTETYNRFHDPQERSPDIQTLRDLHARMDVAVLAAYGWTDLPTACDFILDYEEDPPSPGGYGAAGPLEEDDRRSRKRKKPWRYRWPDEIRDEVLARLLKLNAERAQEEKLAGLAAAAAAPAKAKRRKDETGRRRGGAAPAQGDLILPPQQDLF